jgi:ABC-type transport system involved in multi-copper enzyme maturation permease subunit
MTWLTWRQFRTQTWITAIALAVAAVVLTVTGRTLAHLWASNTPGDFLTLARNGVTGTLYLSGGFVLYAVPGLIGVFWGAPLIARELETGTHRLVWNQSVTRTRWLATKLGTLGLASMATAGLLSLAISWWAHRIDQVSMDRITPELFGARGIVPIGYAAFAFTLGATAGMLLRRTVPAMAATLALYVAAVASMALFIRTHLVAARHSTVPLDVANLHGLMISRNGGEMRVMGDNPYPGAWIVSNQAVDSAGHSFTGPANLAACGMNAPVRACQDWLGTLHLRQAIAYHPASQFWSLQWAETGVFVGLAVALAGFCFWWARRRLT